MKRLFLWTLCFLLPTWAWAQPDERVVSKTAIEARYQAERRTCQAPLLRPTVNHKICLINAKNKRNEARAQLQYAQRYTYKNAYKAHAVQSKGRYKLAKAQCQLVRRGVEREVCMQSARNVYYAARSDGKLIKRQGAERLSLISRPRVVHTVHLQASAR